MDKREYKMISIFSWEGTLKTYFKISLVLLVLACPIVVFPFFNSAEGPIDTIKGNVVGVFMDGSFIYHVPEEVVHISLPSGILVDSIMPRHLFVLKGDTVTVEVYQHRITGSKDYRVVKVEKKKSNSSSQPSGFAAG